MANLLIRGGLVYDAVHETPYVADILCKDGKIETIAPDISAPENCEIVNAEGMNVYPSFSCFLLLSL